MKMEISATPTTKILSTSVLDCCGPMDSKKSSKSETTVNIPTTTLMTEPVIFTGGKCSSRIEVNRTECISAVTGSVSSSEKDFHVVKIQISPDQKIEDNNQRQEQILITNSDVVLERSDLSGKQHQELVKKPKVSIVSLRSSVTDDHSLLVNSSRAKCENISHTFLGNSEKISIPEDLDKTTLTIFSPAARTTSNEMVQKPSGDLEVSNPGYLYYMMTSGQCSPSDTLDSGTCSDMENNSNNNSTSNSVTPPPIPKKAGTKIKMHLKTTKVITQEDSLDGATNEDLHHHTRTGSLTDSEESESSLSYDSLNSSEFARTIMTPPSPPLPSSNLLDDSVPSKLSFLPDSLLRDIRDRKFTNTNKESNGMPFMNGLKMKTTDQLPSKDELRDRNKTCVLITQDKTDNIARTFENDKFYTFHINEKDVDDLDLDHGPKILRDDETFAGYRDIHSGTSTIRSSKGTVRGVKNRVRNGIATFLQMQQSNVKNYKEKDSGKVVLYTTSMGIVRETYAKCSNVKQILRTLLVKFEERDVFMSCDYQQEIKERMQSEEIQVPQLFVEGQHIGDATTVERLNESGELRKMLKPYKSITSSYTCQVCGGYRLLPCSSCNGSKKSVHRNHFTAEFVALKCMNCDEVGLVKCHNC